MPTVSEKAVATEVQVVVEKPMPVEVLKHVDAVREVAVEVPKVRGALV